MSFPGKRTAALMAWARLTWEPGAAPAPGVYLLLRAGVVVYVGKSVFVAERVPMHGLQKGHDAVITLRVEIPDDAPDLAHDRHDDWLHQIEYALIQKFDPEHNARRDPCWKRAAGWWAPLFPEGGP